MFFIFFNLLFLTFFKIWFLEIKSDHDDFATRSQQKLNDLQHKLREYERGCLTDLPYIFPIFLPFF